MIDKFKQFLIRYKQESDLIIECNSKTPLHRKLSVLVSVFCILLMILFSCLGVQSSAEDSSYVLDGSYYFKDILPDDLPTVVSQVDFSYNDCYYNVLSFGTSNSGQTVLTFGVIDTSNYISAYVYEPGVTPVWNYDDRIIVFDNASVDEATYNFITSATVPLDQCYPEGYFCWNSYFPAASFRIAGTFYHNGDTYYGISCSPSDDPDYLVIKYYTNSRFSESIDVALYSQDSISWVDDSYRFIYFDGSASLSATSITNLNAFLHKAVPSDYSDTITVYFRNNWLWSDVRYYCWVDDLYDSVCNNFPGSSMSYVSNDGEFDIYSAVIPSNSTGLVFTGIKNDGSGSLDQSPDIYDGIFDGAGWEMAWSDGNSVSSFVYSDHVSDPNHLSGDYVFYHDLFDAEPSSFIYFVDFTSNGIQYNSFSVGQSNSGQWSLCYANTETSIFDIVYTFDALNDQNWINYESRIISFDNTYVSDEVLSFIKDKSLPTSDLSLSGCYTFTNAFDFYFDIKFNFTSDGVSYGGIKVTPSSIGDVVAFYSSDCSTLISAGLYVDDVLCWNSEFFKHITLDGTSLVSPEAYVLINSYYSLTSYSDFDDTIQIYFYNNWLWSDVRVYCWIDYGGFNINNSWPGESMTLVDNDGSVDIYSYNVPKNCTGIIFTGIKNDGSGNLDQSPNITQEISSGSCWKMVWIGANSVERFDYSSDSDEEPDDPIEVPVPTPDPDPNPPSDDNSGDYNSGYNDGYNKGFYDSYEDAYKLGYNKGLESGYQNGYTVGYSDAVNSGQSSSLGVTLFSDIFNLPANVLSQIVLGQGTDSNGNIVTVSLWSILSTLIVAVLVFYAIKLFTR